MVKRTPKIPLDQVNELVSESSDIALERLGKKYIEEVKDVRTGQLLEEYRCFIVQSLNKLLTNVKKPKHTITLYQVFIKSKFKEFKGENPDLKVNAVEKMSEFAQEWRNLSDDAKQEYIELRNSMLDRLTNV